MTELRNPIASFREIQTEVAQARKSAGGALQYLGMFPGPEAGVADPFLHEYLSAGETLERERPQGLREIETLAQRGSVLSMLFVADACRKGSDYKVDLEKSERWYAHAASLGSGRALYGLGLISLTKREVVKAIEFLQAAGDRGSGAAIWTLGLLYKQGGGGISPDLERARALLERGASLGHVWSLRTLSILLMTERFGLWARLRGVALYLASLPAAVIAVRGGKVDRIIR